MDAAVQSPAAPEDPRYRESVDVAVVGGGQSALAAAFWLRRSGLSYVLLDAQDGPGGAWQHGWDSLCLFSPAQWSSLPGWMMPGGPEHYPTRDEVVAYLAEYERRYEVPVRRPARVTAVRRDGEQLALELAEPTGRKRVRARAVISATGTWEHPWVPDMPVSDGVCGEARSACSFDERPASRLALMMSFVPNQPPLTNALRDRLPELKR